MRAYKIRKIPSGLISYITIYEDLGNHKTYRVKIKHDIPSERGEGI